MTWFKYVLVSVLQRNRTNRLCFSSVQFSRSVVSDSLRPHESQHARPPCPSPTPGVHPDSRPSSQWCHPAISSSVVPFSSCPQSLPASESFPMSQFFAWGGQSTGVSALASFLTKNTQDWSPLEWTDWMCINIHKRRFIIRIGACSYGVKKLMRKPTINHFKLGKKGKVQNKFWKSHITPLHWQ